MKITLSITEAKTIISNKFDGAAVEITGSPAPAAPLDTVGENQRMISFLRALVGINLGNNKITIIKLFRCAFNSGLAEAKNAIEQPNLAIAQLSAGVSLSYIMNS